MIKTMATIKFIHNLCVPMLWSLQKCEFRWWSVQCWFKICINFFSLKANFINVFPQFCHLMFKIWYGSIQWVRECELHEILTTQKIVFSLTMVSDFINAIIDGSLYTFWYVKAQVIPFASTSLVNNKENESKTKDQ